jgi:hypothetical protein
LPCLVALLALVTLGDETMVFILFRVTQAGRFRKKVANVNMLENG